MTVEIYFKRLTKLATLPTKAHQSDSGWDLYAAEDVIIAPGETVVVKTNIACALPEGYEAQVRPRSGITSKTKLRVQLGTIDNAYRGDIGIIVDNTFKKKGKKKYTAYKIINNRFETYLDSNELYRKNTYKILEGDKIAQLVVQALPQTVAVEVDELPSGERGSNGFGSSGM